MRKCKYSKCNNYFEPRKSGTPQIFCNSKCQWKNRDEVHPEYRTNYSRKPEAKFKKRLWREKTYFSGNATLINKQCFYCAIDKSLIIHHLDGNNGKQDRFLNNNSDNLLVLCRSCHPKIHNKWWRKELNEVGFSRQ